jgi:D-alanyl-D-alanine carboxypeptidase
MFFVALLVFLEIFNVPLAKEKVESLAFLLTKKSFVNTPASPPSALPLQIETAPLFLPLKQNKKEKPYLNAQGGIVIDLPTSQILFAQNIEKRFPIASLTKIMTALVALENYNLKDILTVPPEAISVSGSKINLRTGEQMTVENLLYGLLLYSGNDAAVTLSSGIGRENFVAKMNEKAKNLGLNSLFYQDEIGLDPQNTANLKDLALLSSFALKNPVFSKIVKTNETTIYSADGQIAHPLKNTNRLLRDFPGTYGVKTGFTLEAGHCLIAAVQRGETKVLSIVVGAPADQFKESEKLLDWIFSSYRWYKL